MSGPCVEPAPTMAGDTSASTAATSGTNGYHRSRAKIRLRRAVALLGPPLCAPAATAADGGDVIPHDRPRKHTDSVSSFPREAEWNSDGHRNYGSRGAGPPLLQDENGTVLPSELTKLRDRMRAAAQREDFHTAAALQAMLRTLAPRSAPLDVPLAALISDDGHGPPMQAVVSDAARFFLEHGFAVCPGRLSQATLARVRAGWHAAEARARAEWQAKAAVSRGRWGLSWASGAPSGFRTFFDLGDLTDGGKPGGEHWALAKALVEVACAPGLLATVRAVLGQDAQANGFPGGRVVPPEDRVPGPGGLGTHGGDDGYTSWHRDSPPCVWRVFPDPSFACAARSD
eukprot:COSAG01_NODE_1848_length_9066_cov_6.023754_5_plen_343_part_00